ncbi:peptide chain release factor N(5)-glutamine methyltransferase [Patescibacteria group bacterium]|nr:peptide chain release factor N(5)-glutamine methyltransferase [Patescibacteria group bacterium]
MTNNKDKQNSSFNEIKKTSLLPRLDFELLLAFASGLSREKLITYPDKNLGLRTLKKYKELEKKRLENWPIAYLLGEKSFYDLNFKVSPKVLVPRPETEILVENILKKVNEIENKKINIIDLGTGSGAIIISLASQIKKINSELFKKINFLGLDISSDALKVAKENAKNNKVETKIVFKKSDLLKILKNKKFNEDFDIFKNPLIISANLPYLKPEEFKQEKSISREPKLALVAGKDGLKYYHELFKQLALITKINSDKSQKNNKLKSLFLICEINPEQVELMKELVNKYLQGTTIKIEKDLAGLDRFVIVSF